MPQLLIDRKQTIAGVQKQFNSAFPFLKIEFFRQAPIPGKGNAKNKMFIYDVKLNEIQNLNKVGTILLSNETTVSELEKLFKDEYGLYVQVFRKSGKVWLETNVTDDWSLEEQNKEGQALSRIIKKDRPDDFHLSED